MFCTPTFVKVVIQWVLERCTGLDTADGGYLRGQRAQGRSDLFDVGRRDALFELEQDCHKGRKT